MPKKKGKAKRRKKKGDKTKKGEPISLTGKKIVFGPAYRKPTRRPPRRKVFTHVFGERDIIEPLLTKGFRDLLDRVPPIQRRMLLLLYRDAALHTEIEYLRSIETVEDEDGEICFACRWPFSPRSVHSLTEPPPIRWTDPGGGGSEAVRDVSLGAPRVHEPGLPLRPGDVSDVEGEPGASPEEQAEGDRRDESARARDDRSMILGSLFGVPVRDLIDGLFGKGIDVTPKRDDRW